MAKLCRILFPLDAPRKRPTSRTYLDVSFGRILAENARRNRAVDEHRRRTLANEYPHLVDRENPECLVHALAAERYALMQKL